MAPSIKKQGDVRIGTSGYTYDHWRGVFYPEDLPSKRWLEYYTKFFKTVELNVTFYRLLQEAAFKSWYKRTPKDFIFVLKGSRFITHVKKLHEVGPATKLFFSRANFLKEKLGVVLWQLPPSWKKNIERLESFLKMVTKKHGIASRSSNARNDSPVRQVFEFRHKSWFCEEIYKLLKKYKAALCVADSPEFPMAEVVTANFVYLRFHGGKILYGSRYSKKEMQEWARKIKKWAKNGFDVYAYFNNDAFGYAVENAKELKKLLNC
jgi:uncharacterized protein YecE (DUF72 family)